MSRGLLVLCFLLAGASGVRGEEPPDLRLGAPFPAETLPRGSAPFYGPAVTEAAAVRSWCDAMIATGRRHHGTRLGGDMLMAAAHAVQHQLAKLDEAAPLFAAAVAAYPPDDPTHGIALYEQGRREAWRGNFPAAARALEGLEQWARVDWPKATSDEDRDRWSGLADIVDDGLPLFRASVYEGQGRFADAGSEIEQRADNVRAIDRERARLWERAARLYNKVPDREATLRAADRLVELAPEGAPRSYWIIWRIYASYGRLTREGAIGPTRGTVDDAFYDELLAVARDRAGYGGMSASYLAMASSAFLGGKLRIALEIYLLALDDPTFAEDALADPGVATGALIAVDLAAQLGRFEDAELLLSIIERLAGQPIENVEMFRKSIEETRTQLDESLRESGREPPQRDPIPSPRLEPARLEPLGRLETGEVSDDPPSGLAPQSPDGEAPGWIWVAGGALVLFGLFAVLRRR